MTSVAEEALEPAAATTAQSRHLRTAQTTYRVALLYMTAMTLIWLFLNVTGVDGGLLFKNYRVSGELLVGIAAAFAVFWIGWSWAFYRLKRYLLRRAGLDETALALVFSNRLADTAPRPG